jgi:hypothetical protein
MIAATDKANAYWLPSRYFKNKTVFDKTCMGILGRYTETL